MTTTAQPLPEQFGVSRVRLNQLRDIALIVSCALTPVFWLLTFQMLSSGKVVPGVPALFVGGITLVAAGFWLQLSEVRSRPSWQAWTLLAFFGGMTLGNLATTLVIFFTPVAWTMLDTVALPASFLAAPLIGLFLKRLNLGNRIAWMVSLSASTKVGLQLVVAGESIIIGKCMPLALILLIFAFGMTRFPSILGQLWANPSRENKALLILEICNVVSVLLLFVTWVVWIL